MPFPRIPSAFAQRLHQTVCRDLSGVLNQHVEPSVGLSRCLALQSMATEEHPATKAVRVLVRDLTRKYCESSANTERSRAAILLFEKIERELRRGLPFLRRPNASHSSILPLAWNPQGPRCDSTERIRELLHEVLGDCPPPWSELVHTRHGPGSTVDCGRRTGTTPYAKYVSYPYTVTRAAVADAKAIIMADERWLDALWRDQVQLFLNHDDVSSIWEQFWSNVLNVVPGCRITTVPKDSQIDRTIAVEPTMNLYAQLGFDGAIRQGLKRSAGIDLNSAERNRDLARQGSVVDYPRGYATIDLKSASDTVSLRVCKALLPDGWFRALCRLRSPRAQLPGSNRRLIKMSSMGNGFTFALESAIFYAVARCAVEDSGLTYSPYEFAIHGDDIVVPAVSALRCCAYLERYGFTVNREKSFLEGPFRESCGTDWYRGWDVRGVFVKKAPDTVQRLCTLHNRLVLWSQRTFGAQVLTGTLAWIRSLVPPGWLLDGFVDVEDVGGWFFLTEDRPTLRYVWQPFGVRYRDFWLGRLSLNLKPSSGDACAPERDEDTCREAGVFITSKVRVHRTWEWYPTFALIQESVNAAIAPDSATVPT